MTSVKYKKFLLGSFSVAKFGIAPFFGSPPVSFQTVALKLKKICNIDIDWAVISPQSEQGGFFFWERVPGDCDYGACGEILVQATDTFWSGCDEWWFECFYRCPSYICQIWGRAGHIFWQLLWWWFECCNRGKVWAWVVVILVDNNWMLLYWIVKL